MRTERFTAKEVISLVDQFPGSGLTAKGGEAVVLADNDESVKSVTLIRQPNKVVVLTVQRQFEKGGIDITSTVYKEGEEYRSRRAQTQTIFDNIGKLPR